MTKALITAAAALHLAATATIYLAGRWSLLPHLFNGQGVMAGDAQTYQSQAALLAEMLAGARFAPWLFALLPLHAKLYSVCFAVFGPLAGASVLAAWPLNAAYFVAALCLIYKLGGETFDRRTGLLAAALVGLWPSFLLHSTQPLRDPLFVAAALLFLLLNSRWLTKTYSPAGALKAAALASLNACVLWLSRADMWELMIGVVCLACVLLGRRAWRGGRSVRWNAAGAGLLLVVSLLLPPTAARFYAPAVRKAESHGVAYADYSRVLSGAGQRDTSGRAGVGSYLPERVSALRGRFVAEYEGAGSSIDTEVRFDSTADVIAHLPRALAVGLFAPFPRAWFGEGARVGRAGRAVAAAETLALYAVELLALVGLWRGRGRQSAWLLFGVSVAGAAALGLVVTNVGALYRMRYVFVMPLVVLACEGAKQFSARAAPGRRLAGQPPAA